MRQIYLTTAFFLFLFGSCSSWKGTLIAKGGRDEAIKNSLTDFLRNGGKLLNADSVFDIHVMNIEDTLWGIDILGSKNKIRPSRKDKIGTNLPGFPTRYYEYNHKLFYWYDSSYFITKEIISVLYKYNHIDSINVIDTANIILGPHGDDGEKGTDYYFCKNNLLKYKKVRTSVAMGWYKAPEIECK